MQIQVIADKDGSIFGCCSLDAGKADDGSLLQVRLHPDENQHTAVVELPPELGQLDSQELWEQFKSSYRLPPDAEELVGREAEGSAQ